MTTAPAPEPLTIDEKGNPPRNRITTASAAWKSYQDALLVGSLDDDRFTSIRGIYDGLPPVDPEDLKKQGLEDVPNFNLRQHQAKVNTYVSTWIDHNCGGDKWAEIQLLRENFDSLDEWRNASEWCSRKFNEALKYWDGLEEQDPSHFIFERVICDTQMGLFGIGVQHFQDHIDWRPCAVPTRNVMPSRGTKIMMNNCQALFIKKPYTVKQLYGYVKDQKTAERTRWNRKQVLDLLYTSTRQPAGNQTSGFESFAEWENRVRNNDIFLQHDFTPIDLVDMYVQEFTDVGRKGISHYVISKWGQNDGQFLYEFDRQFRRWREIVIPFCDSTGPEGDWHGVKGFGDLIFDSCHFNNVFFNQVALATMMGMMPMFQAGQESDRQKLQQIVFSRLCVLFPDLNIAQLKLNTDISGALAVLGESNRVQNTNTRIFPQNDNGPRGETPTATQVTFDRQDQAQFTSLQIKFYRLTGADPILSEQYRRLTKPASEYPDSWPGGETAKWFREQCEEYGLKHKQYAEVEYVRASRTGGSGNMSLDSIKADEAMKVATPGKGQLSARKEKIAALYGYERVDEFIESADNPIPEDALIQLENATLQDGQGLDALPFQFHERHLGEPTPEGKGHLALLIVAQQAAMALDEAGVETSLPDAIKLHKVLEAGVQHADQHVGFMTSLEVNEPVVKQLSKTMNDFRQFTENFGKSIENAMKKAAEQQPQGQDAEQQAELMKTQAEIERENAKTAAEIQRMNVKEAAKLENMQRTAESRTALKEQDAAIKAGLDTEQALIDQQRQKLELQKQEEAAKTRAKANAKKTKPK